MYISQFRNSKLLYCYCKAKSYFQPYINTKFDADEIIPGLYLGSVTSSASLENLRERGITHIFPVHIGSTKHFENDGINYTCVDMLDNVDEDIQKHLHFLADKIKECLDKKANLPRNIPHGNILIHCMQGVSRSTTTVAAYLVKHRKYTPAEALEHIKRIRPIANPNSNYLCQLEIFYRSIV